MAVEHAIGTTAGVRNGLLGRAADELIRSSSRARVTARTAAVFGAAMVAGTVVLLVRQRGAGSVGTIWAEDGTIFLAQARTLGAARAFLEPYAGYMHAVPRMVSTVVAALPLRAADTGFAVLSSLCAAGAAGFVFRASYSHLRSTWARVAVSAPVVLAPLGGSEILASVANVHWYLLYVAFWAVVWRPPSRWETAVAAAVVVLAVLSDPFVLLLAPLAGLRLLAARWRPDPIVAGFALAGALQLVVAAGASARPPVEGDKTSVVLIPARYVVEVAGRGLAGDRLVGEGGLSARGAAVALVVVAALAVLVFVRRRVVPARAYVLGALLCTSALYFMAPVAISGVSPPRYAFAPTLLVLAAAVVLLEGWDLRAAATPVRAGALVAGAAMALCWAVGLPSVNDRADGPAWDASLAKAASSCAPGRPVAVDLAPDGWFVQLPCDDIVDATGLTPVPAAP